MEQWESMGISSFKIIGVNRPNHGSGNIQEIDEFSFNAHGFFIIISNPIGSIISIGSLVAIVNNNGPIFGFTIG